MHGVFHARQAKLAGAGEDGGLLGGAGLLVNTTSLGMVGLPKMEINLRCQPSMVVADLVYVPLQTDLLAAARDKGLRTADGLGMLLHQAVRGFELWFGVKPEVTPELRKLIEDDLIAEGLEATAEAKAKAAKAAKDKAKDKPKIKVPKAPRPPKMPG